MKHERSGEWLVSVGPRDTRMSAIGTWLLALMPVYAIIATLCLDLVEQSKYGRTVSFHGEKTMALVYTQEREVKVSGFSSVTTVFRRNGTLRSLNRMAFPRRGIISYERPADPEETVLWNSLFARR